MCPNQETSSYGLLVSISMFLKAEIFRTSLDAGEIAQWLSTCHASPGTGVWIHRTHVNATWAWQPICNSNLRRQRQGIPSLIESSASLNLVADLRPPIAQVLPPTCVLPQMQTYMHTCNRHGKRNTLRLEGIEWRTLNCLPPHGMQ